MQTLNLDQRPSSAGRHATYQPSTVRLSRKSAEAACAPFFATSALAGTLDSDERGAMIDAVVEIVPVASRQALPLRRQRSAYRHLLVEGWAYRSITLRDGSRQITDILLPGDPCDRPFTDPNDIINDLRACGAARVAVLRGDAFDSLREPALSCAMEWAHHREALILRSRLASVGRRDARGRVAHLMCELYYRLRPLGLAIDGAFECPMTQEQVADALGLTPVHVNRTLQVLRRCGLLTLHKRMVVISDLLRLNAEAGLDDEAFKVTCGGRHELS